MAVTVDNGIGLVRQLFYPDRINKLIRITYLPELGTNLVTALACLNVDNFSHGCLSVTRKGSCALANNVLTMSVLWAVLGGQPPLER